MRPATFPLRGPGAAAGSSRVLPAAGRYPKSNLRARELHDEKQASRTVSGTP